MESAIIRLKVGLLSVFCCLSWFAAAQTSEDNDKEMLLGKWIFEEASIADPENPISFDIENDYIKFYGRIEIEGDTVFLTDRERTQKINYEADGKYLAVDLPSGEPWIAEWMVLDDKLYLEFDGFHPYDESKKVKVLLVYKQE